MTYLFNICEFYNWILAVIASIIAGYLWVRWDRCQKRLSFKRKFKKFNGVYIAKSFKKHNENEKRNRPEDFTDELNDDVTTRGYAKIKHIKERLFNIKYSFPPNGNSKFKGHINLVTDTYGILYYNRIFSDTKQRRFGTKQVVFNDDEINFIPEWTEGHGKEVLTKIKEEDVHEWAKEYMEIEQKQQQSDKKMVF